MKRHKYGATPMTLDGIRFDSMGEAARYSELKIAEIAGLIKELALQPRFPLHSGTGLPICTYVADFSYVDGGRRVIEDFKGVETAVFKLKKKWFQAEYGDRYELRITKRRSRPPTS